MLVIQGSFSSCWAVPTLSQGCFCFPSQHWAAGGAQGFGRGQGVTADPKWPQEYSIPEGIRLGSKTEGKVGWAATVEGLAGVLVVSDCFHLHAFSFLDFICLFLLFSFYYNLLLLFCFISVINLFLCKPMSFLTSTLLVLFPPSHWWYWLSSCGVLSCHLWLSHGIAILDDFTFSYTGNLLFNCSGFS